MRQHGKNAYGIELSRAVLEKECPDLLSKNYVEPGILTNLPFEDNWIRFGHVLGRVGAHPPEEVDQVVKELVRVSRRLVSLHLLERTYQSHRGQRRRGAQTHHAPPERMVAQHFPKTRARRQRGNVMGHARKDFSYVGDKLGDCRWGKQDDGGLYEVCNVDNKWLVGKREQENLRRDRCITSLNKELEPWFFSFQKIR